MKNEPKTAEELFECEEFQPYRIESLCVTTADMERGYIEYEGKQLKLAESVRVGDTIHVPAAIKGYAVAATSPDSLVRAIDAEGVAWRPVHHDGVWKKEKLSI